MQQLIGFLFLAYLAHSAGCPWWLAIIGSCLVVGQLFEKPEQYRQRKFW